MIPEEYCDSIQGYMQQSIIYRKTIIVVVVAAVGNGSVCAEDGVVMFAPKV